MENASSRVAEIIARNIGHLESAVEIAAGEMDSALFDAACEVLRGKLGELGWESELGYGFEDESWFAPPEWVAAGGERGLRCRLGVDDYFHTSLAAFCGVPDGKGEKGRVFIDIGTEATLARKGESLPDDLRAALDKAADDEAAKAAGFRFEVKKRRFAIRVPVDFDQETIARGFGDGDLPGALESLARALDKISLARAGLDPVAGMCAEAGGEDEEDE